MKEPHATIYADWLKEHQYGDVVEAQKADVDILVEDLLAHPPQSSGGNNGLVEAVRRLYYAAHWSPDRDVDAKKLWQDVRDAAGFESGHAPTPQALGYRVNEIGGRIVGTR